ncbi:TfoX/Sxy family protein [Microbacterium sp. NPDC056234]|uniref:TfoX/Sxy family protein n=1 Tax=Microbacterium sp. NPDC056234 TaxID=3345757 RepID=UPI0035E2C459
MTPEQAALIERLRSLLAAEPTMREVSMFGGRSIMVNEKMVVAAQRDGALLVRIAAERHDALLAEPGAAQAEMGAGRDMGPGWIEVEASTIAGDDRLAFWIAAAMEHHRAMTDSL